MGATCIRLSAFGADVVCATEKVRQRKTTETKTGRHRHRQTANPECVSYEREASFCSDSTDIVEASPLENRLLFSFYFSRLRQVLFVRMALDASGSALDTFLRQFDSADVDSARELYRL